MEVVGSSDGRTSVTVGPAAADKPLLTVPEAARVLNVHQRTVRRLAEAGGLEQVRVGRAVRITPRSVEALMHPQT
jgi:excisionase family DNA binding protein